MIAVADCTYCSFREEAADGEEAMRILIAHTLEKHPEHRDAPLLRARRDLWPEGAESLGQESAAQ